MPLPCIQPPAAAAAGPATTRAQPKKQVALKNQHHHPVRGIQGGTPGRDRPLAQLPPWHLPAAAAAAAATTATAAAATRSSPTCTHSRSLRNPGVVTRPEPEAAVPATQYTINLTAEATWLVLRRHLENQWGWMNPFGGTGLLPGSQSRAGLNLTSLMKISLLNEESRNDDEEYEEDLALGVEWLRGVEEVKREGKLETLPHLDDH